MGSLRDFDTYLAERKDVASAAETRLAAVLAKFETFFAEVTKVREAELEQLGAYVAQGPDKLPAGLAKAVDAARAYVVKDLDEQIAVLELEHKELVKEAEEIRATSLHNEGVVRQRNVDLDAREESLKMQNEELLAKIDENNARIRELGTGFGFFKNFFAMRRLHAKSVKLQSEQEKVVAQVNWVRTSWREREADWNRDEGALCKQWAAVQTNVSAAQAKIDAIKDARPQMTFRATLERVLFEQQPKQVVATATDPKCPRCQSPNPKEHHFCQICAQRLLPDRPDLEGSLEEIAEANQHHARFSEGMRKCQEIIALVRGLGSGLLAFRKSVTTMIETESRHSLAPLRISVPAACVQYGKNLEALRDAAEPNLSLHPKAFGERMETFAKPFTEEQIKAWFEGMGAELSACAKAQWG
jgi:hypothetical protein